MIWFACKQCKKVHGRGENSIGAMVFCDCGQSLMVPWESTAAEPEVIPLGDVPAVPKLDPLQFEPWRSTPVGEPSSVPRVPQRLNVTLPPPLAPLTARRSPRPIDPTSCFNHEGMPPKATCKDCNLNFCDECVCTFDGVPLCGPCKNYRTKLLQRPARAGVWARAAFVVALLGAPVLFIVFPLSLGWWPMLMGLAIVPEVVAIGLGIFVLWRHFSRRQALDGSLACAGITAGMVLMFLATIIALYGTKLVVNT